MPAQQTAQFSVFWSILVPAAMAVGSILITYLLYRHFADGVEQDHRK
jgi:hypothetical protein